MAYIPGTNPVAKPPDEVFHLSDSANAAIPADIREQFQTDEQGRVLFFTKPPLDVLPPTKNGGPPMHSLKYLAAKLRRQKAEREKLEASMKLPLDEQKRNSEENHRKRIKLEEEKVAKDLQALEEKSMLALAKWLDQGTDAIYKHEWGALWQEAKRLDGINMGMAQAEEQEKQRRVEENAKKRKAKDIIPITNKGPFLDDFDPRY